MKQPDDATIQSWLEGELEGNALREMESWAEQNADQLEAAMGWDSLKSEIQSTVPASEEPPYADFFNERVKHQTVEEHVETQPEAAKPTFWQRINWMLAPTALAGMTLCFYLGTKVESGESALPTPVVASVVNEGVYTPVSGVSSEVVEMDDATVIVLEGLDEIPESLDIVAGESSHGVSPFMMVKAEREPLYF